MIRFLIVIIACIAFAGASASALAEEENTHEEAHAEGVEKIKKKARQAKESLDSALKDVSDNLKDKDKKHFYILYNNHNIMATVEDIRDDIGQAVQSCADNNEKMASELTARYDRWTKAVNEKLDEARGQVQNMIIAQSYKPEEDIRKILEKADQVRSHTKEIYQKVPVTTQKACEKLLKKMDKTQDNMLALLSSTLISIPRALQDSKNAPENEKEEDKKNDSKPEEL